MVSHHRLLAHLLVILFCCSLNGDRLEARPLITHRPMMSFAHFLYGTSGAFPPAAAFDRDLLKWKQQLTPRTVELLDRMAVWFRAGVASFPSEHAFETVYYQVAAGCKTIDELRKAWAKSGFPVADDRAGDIKELWRIFNTHFSAETALVDREIARLNALPELRQFEHILGSIERLHRFAGAPRQRLRYDLVAVPLRLKPQEMQELKARGRNALFGRSFGPLQVIELLLIPEIPELSRKMLSHLLGVGLHEIVHYHQTESALRSLLKKHLPVETDVLSGLTATYLFEGLATALGNGLFAEATGSSDPQWYARDSINRFGHALFPLVKRMIAANRPFDREFCLEARSVFARTFPRYDRYWEFAFNRVVPHASEGDWNILSNHLKNHLPGFSKADPDDARRPLTNVSVFRHDGSFEGMPKHLAERVALFAPLRKGFALSGFSRDAQTFDIVFVVDNPGQIESLVDKIFKYKYCTSFVLLP